MRTIPVLVLILFFAGNRSCVTAQDPLQKLQIATKLANAIEDSVLQARALAVVAPEPDSFEVALMLIAKCPTNSDKLRLMRKLARAGKYKPCFDRALTTGELNKIERILGPIAESEDSGITLLALMYLDVDLNRSRVDPAIRMIESAPSGPWKDAVYFTAIYTLMTRSHLSESIQGSSLRLDNTQRIPLAFATQAEQIAGKIETENLRDYAHVLIAMATVDRAINRALRQIESISSPVLRDKTRLQAVQIMVTGKASHDDLVQVTVSSAEKRRFTLHRQ